jgi:hypothetical protein
MAGNRYGDGDDRRRGGDDRGWLQRAREEVRSVLSSDEGRSDSGGDEDGGEPWGGGDWADGIQGGRYRESHYGPEHGFGGFQGDYGGGQAQGGFGGAGDYRGGRQSFSGGGRPGSHWDDHYRSWRERQIVEMDRDYEDYCRESRQSFHSDFDSWRKNREAQGGSGLGTSASTGSSGSEGDAGSSGAGRPED